MNTLAKEINKNIIIPTLKQTNLWSESAEILVYGTGMVETNYSHIIQIGEPINGGIGFFQDEPSDYFDLSSWLKNGFSKGMIERVLNATCYTSLPGDPMILVSNIKLAVLFCRLHYYRIKQPLPIFTDARGMAEYHKKWYNSSLGCADVDKNTEIFKKIISGEL